MRIFSTKFTQLTVTTAIFSKMPKERRHVKISIEAPNNWQKVYDNILEMRKDKNAPVDTMGCEKVSEMSSDPKVQRFPNISKLNLRIMFSFNFRFYSFFSVKTQSSSSSMRYSILNYVICNFILFFTGATFPLFGQSNVIQSD